MVHSRESNDEVVVRNINLSECDGRMESGEEFRTEMLTGVSAETKDGQLSVHLRVVRVPPLPSVCSGIFLGCSLTCDDSACATDSLPCPLRPVRIPSPTIVCVLRESPGQELFNVLLSHS